jgi:putative tryptophan/tyrosine transport system substrate-binding protein
MTVDISRRQLIAVLGGAAVCPSAARAQQSGKLVTIGFLGSSTPSTTIEMVAAFVQRLRERGWIEGSNLAIAYRWAEGRTERLSEIAAELVRLKVDVIVTIGSSAARAAKQETSVIPIIFALVGDPVGIDLVASLARPGGNITGFSNEAIDLGAKKLDFLHDVVPGLRRLAIMFNVGNPGNMLEMTQVQTAAHKLGVEVIKLEIRRPEDIEAALDAVKGRADAVYIPPDGLLNANRIRIINNVVLVMRLPTMHGFRDDVEAGGLMSYGPNFADLLRLTADYVDRVLRGAKPADLPVQQPTEFTLVINHNTAKSLGLHVPEKLLALADEVIE